MNKFEYSVTVVIPVYNSHDYITECVNSLVHQDYDFSKIEIILVNDGSTDESYKVCEEFSKKYDNIKYIYKENSGVSDTRNQGVKIAKGKYIMLLDSDDYLAKYTIGNLITFFDEHYNEIDLATYPIYWDRNGKISLHSRYSKKNYDKGTGIYDLDEYPHLNQSTVNIIFKNDFENNLLYDTSMKLSEDQNFNTTLLMRKNKIGFVQKGVYYYRRHEASVSQTRNNPYYCFNDIMSYNEGLLTRFKINGKVPKYVQTLIINTFKWRIDTDELLPYYLEGKEYEEGVNRIVNILKNIDNDVIVKHSNCSDFVKLYLLKWKFTDIRFVVNKDGFKILTNDNLIVCEDEYVNCYLFKNKIKNGKIEMFASFVSPILECFPVSEYIVEGIKTDGSKFTQTNKLIQSKVPARNTKMNTAHNFTFTYIFDPKEIKSFKFYVLVNDIKLSFNPIYIKFSGFIKKYHRHSIPLENYRLVYNIAKNNFKILKRNSFIDLVYESKSLLYFKKKMPSVLYYRNIAKKTKKIWLYSDSEGVIDNAYYQFIHDFDKNDGIEKYYVVIGDDSYLKGKFTEEQKKFVIKHKSKKHKELFLQCEKIFVSFTSISIYSPFKNIAWYSDLLNYQLIYLQHGILHASLQRSYAKEFTEIDKFIISSEFEKNNLIENYDYSPEDLIMSGMPRMKINKETVKAKNKVLFAPSWRQYLIGQFVNNKRKLRDKEFLESDFFNEINNFLHSSELQEILAKNNLELDFKLHPIFKEYRKYFNVDDLSNVDINFEKTILDEYKIFITDFSSYQFDYVKLVRPIIYFLPDTVEMRAGIHSYRSLDLKYEDAFGPLCLTSNELLDTLKQVIQNNYTVEEPYKERMENFFTVSDDPCETIYNILIDEK